MIVDDYNITPADFHKQLESGEISAAQVLDVREPWEWEFYHIEGTRLLPMNSVPGGISSLPEDQTIYVICAHGVRSMAVCDYLIRSGVENVKNVMGGMAAVSGLRGFQYD
jgi:rhodanese-related sulfurtransferase